MAQSISYILTKEKNNINSEFIHYKENNYTIIFLDVCHFEIEDFIEIAKKYENIDQVIEHILTIEKEDVDLVEIAKTINKLNLNSFVLEHYSDWADITVEEFSLAVKDKIILTEDIDNWKKNKLSIGFDEQEYSEFKIYKYRNFEDCKNNYQKL
jgi:hypothetical protein